MNVEQVVAIGLILIGFLFGWIARELEFKAFLNKKTFSEKRKEAGKK